MSISLCHDEAEQALLEPTHRVVPHAVLAAGFGSTESLVRAYSDILTRLTEAGYPTIDQLFKTHAILMKDNLALRTKLIQAECQLSSAYKDTTLPYELFPLTVDPEVSGLQNS